MLVVTTFGAPPAPPGRMRRQPKPREATPGGPPPEVPLSRLTVVRPTELGDGQEAAVWLQSIVRDSDALETLVDEAVLVVNRALYAHRAAAQDPSGGDVSRSAAVAVRVGYGSGQRLVDGKFDEALEVPPVSHRRRRRGEALRPQERVAAVLGGKDSVDACEAMLLRARGDLDAGRSREAALQLRAGLDALLAELPGRAGPGQEQDLATLEQRHGAVAAAASDALAGLLSEERLDEIRETLEICERVLRRRRVMAE